MEAGPRVILDSRHEAMLTRIPVKVIEKSLQIVLVFTSVLPEPALPHCAFAVLLPRCAYLTSSPAGSQVFSGKRLLDCGPAQRILVIIQRKRPDRMQMIRQQHDRNYSNGRACCS